VVHMVDFPDGTHELKTALGDSTMWRPGLLQGLQSSDVPRAASGEEVWSFFLIFPCQTTCI
jgi:hypothetical protein